MQLFLSILLLNNNNHMYCMYIYIRRLKSSIDIHVFLIFNKCLLNGVNQS